MSGNDSAPSDSVDPSPAHVAQSPFDQLTADVILRSSDRVDFRVHRTILSQASPVFSDMFSLPQPNSASVATDGSETLPIVDVSEDAKTLRELLLICYPVTKEDLKTLEDIEPVLNAAQKYSMAWPIMLLARYIVALIPRSPLRVWTVACRTGLDDVSRQAANEIKGKSNQTTSAISIMDTMLKQEGVQILEGVNAGQYYRLRQFLRSSFMSSFFNMTMSTSSTAQEAPILRLPPSPSPSPDVIIESSDGHQVPTHHVIIALHSPTLLADVDTPILDSVSRLPVYKVALQKRALVDLLGICYWGEDTLTTDLRRLASMIAAAERYGMTRILRDVRKQWDKCAAQSPLEAYFVSVMNLSSDPAVVRETAKKTLVKPLVGMYTGIMEDASAMSYQRLLEYHTECTKSVCAELRRSSVEWKSAIQPVAWTGGYSSSDKLPPTAISNVVDRLEDMSKKIEQGDAGPLKSVAEFNTHALISAATNSSNWPSFCRTTLNTFARAMLKMETTLQPAISASVNKVALAV